MSRNQSPKRQEWDDEKARLEKVMTMVCGSVDQCGADSTPLAASILCTVGFYRYNQTSTWRNKSDLYDRWWPRGAL